MKKLFVAFIITMTFLPLIHLIFSFLVFSFSKHETYIEAFFDGFVMFGSITLWPIYSVLLYSKMKDKQTA